METYFSVGSETYAEKAQRLLGRYRYPYRVTKTTGTAGCAYRFRVAAPAEELFSLLTAHGIPYQRL
ncbi:MAG: hypothetical protein IKQ91_09225 [Oscillospiraceae bacterium]|nr:hypothetical protein [Oscillospiraceae bacterium]